MSSAGVALSTVPPPPCLFPPPPGAAASRAPDSNLDGLHSLSECSIAHRRKPLLGYVPPAHDAEDVLASSSVTEEAPALQQSNLSAFFKRPRPPIKPEADFNVDQDGAARRPAADADAADDLAPAWAESGGMVVSILEECAQGVLRRDGKLLTSDERRYLALFVPGTPLSLPARALYARLLARKGVAFGLATLDYADVGSPAATAAAAEELQAVRLVRVVSVSGADDSCVDAAAAGLALELLTGGRLKPLCAAAGVPSRAPLAPRGGAGAACSAAGGAAGSAVSTTAADGLPSSARVSSSVAEQRRLLRLRLGLPSPAPRLQPPRITIDGPVDAAASRATTDGDGRDMCDGFAGAGSSGKGLTTSSGGGGGARLRPAQRSALVRRALGEIGAVILLTEPPLAACLRAERLFFCASYCADISAAAAAAMGCRSMRPPEYALPSGPPSPLLPCRALLHRWESALALATAYDASLGRGMETAAGHLACLAFDYLVAVEARRLREPSSLLVPAPAAGEAARTATTAAMEEEAEVAATLATLATGGLDGIVQTVEGRGTRSAGTHAATTEDGEGTDAPPMGAEVLDGGGWCLSSLHPAEAEEFEAHRLSQPAGGRASTGVICASVLTVHVALLEKRREYHAAAHLLQLLLRLPFCPRRRGHWWSRLAIDRDHLAREHPTLRADGALLFAVSALSPPPPPPLMPPNAP